jgi:hypothetical protein
MLVTPTARRQRRGEVQKRGEPVTWPGGPARRPLARVCRLALDGDGQADGRYTWARRAGRFDA